MKSRMALAAMMAIASGAMAVTESINTFSIPAARSSTKANHKHWLSSGCGIRETLRRRKQLANGQHR